MRYLYPLALLLAIMAAGCATSRQVTKGPIVTIDEREITAEEFKYVFEKNNLNQNRSQITEQDLRDYLDLFINFKLKVMEAEALGYHQDSVFLEEFEIYRQQLAEPYLAETEVLDSLSRITYQRLREEVKASHILLALEPGASPADTAAAYQKALELRERIIQGQDFNQLAMAHSDDPSAVKNEGDLGYFSAMQMVYNFEQAAYALEVGQVSQPIRSRFGYHLIQLQDRRPSRGQIQVSHILIRPSAAEDSAQVADKAKSVHRLASNGDDWDALCRNFSQDQGTRDKGGLLPWFKTGEISNIPAFEAAAFALKDTGDIAPPVQTSYGWHIIRLEGKKGLPEFEVMEEEIKARISRSAQGELQRREKLKLENKFIEYPATLELAAKQVNDSLMKGNWVFEKTWNNLNDLLFSIEDRNYQLKDLFNYLQTHQPYPDSNSPLDALNKAYVNLVETELLNFEKEHLAQKYPEYGMLVREYREGLLLFRLMEDKIWNQALLDSVGLKDYFLNNRDRYQWPSRASATIYNTADEAILTKLKEFLQHGQLEYLKYDFSGADTTLNKAQVKIIGDMARQLVAGKDRFVVMEFANNADNNLIKKTLIKQLQQYGAEPEVVERHTEESSGFVIFVASKSPYDLAEKLNQSQELALQVETGRYQPDAHPLMKEIPWEEGHHEMKKDERWLLVNIQEIIPAGPQELEEIKGKVISDYQDKLEQDWVGQLREKYTVTINEKIVNEILEQYQD